MHAFFTYGKYILILLFIFALLFIGTEFMTGKKLLQIDKYIKKPISKEPIRYMPLGDSYTIGEGVGAQESYPSLLVNHLKQEGFNIHVITNPAVSGYTSVDVINYELSICEQEKPNFVTLLIGGNDVAQHVGVEEFRENFIIILDRILAVLPSNKRLIVLTIPDFSVTPFAKNYDDIYISNVISQFNTIIQEEAVQRHIKVVDLFVVSRDMGNDQTLILPDGLHPSAKEYKEWEKLIFPVAYELLNQ